jgi:hypothetical protein
MAVSVKTPDSMQVFSMSHFIEIIARVLLQQCFFIHATHAIHIAAEARA